MLKNEELMTASLDSFREISVYGHERYYGGRSDSFRLVDYASGELTLLTVIGSVRSGSYAKYLLKAPELTIGKQYLIMADYGLTCPLDYGLVVRTAEFDQKYTYQGDDLGAVQEPDYLRLALWAPTASEVMVSFFHEGKTSRVPLKRYEKGVWRAILPGNYDGYGYTYLVKVNGGRMALQTPFS